MFSTFKAFLSASHFQPTIFVTAVSFLLARELWWEGPAYIIAVGVFFGQLVVGFTNDLNDFADDNKHSQSECKYHKGIRKHISILIHCVLRLVLLV